MAFSAQVLNSDATLNNFQIIGALDFIPGAEQTLVLRILDSSKNIRHIFPTTTVITATFNQTDGTTFTKTLSLWADDRSIMTTVLEESETLNLSSGTILLDFDINGDGSSIQKAIARGVLRREVVSC